MKKILFLLITLSCVLVSCDKNEWGNGAPSMDNVFYVGFQQWSNDFKNSVQYNVNRNDTLSIPVQFYSEQVRSFSVSTFYYVADNLVRGVDYEVTDKDGNILTPDSNGAFTMTWPKALKGIQRVYIKALNKGVGSFTVRTFDPNAAVPISSSDVNTTTNNKTKDYEVRAFSQNYKVTVNIK